MTGAGVTAGTPVLPPGYTLRRHRAGPVGQIRILAPDGLLAASGYAAETAAAFVYDRIITTPAHRRRGLGRALMAALAQERRSPATTPVLTATIAGRALYETLGWTVHASWTSATVPASAQ